MIRDIFRQHKVLAFSLLCCLFNINLIQAKQDQSVPLSVVFDLGGVLFKSSYLNALWEVGPFNLAHWACNDAPTWNIGSEIRHTFFTFLNRVTPRDAHCPPARDASGLLLPQCMCDWALGRIRGTDLLKKLETIIELHPEYFASNNEATIIKALCQITFNPEKLAQLRAPVKNMWQFVRNCKKMGYKVYVLSNRDTQTINYMMQEFPYFEKLIDGILTSSEAGTLKPDPEIFHQLFKKFKISPECSIFFDDRIENISAAKQVGMNTVWCYKGKKFKHILEDFDEIADQLAGDFLAPNSLEAYA